MSQRYITCITRMMLNSHMLKSNTCRGEPSLFDTHCCFCHYWIENRADEESARELRERKDEEAADSKRRGEYDEECTEEENNDT